MPVTASRIFDFLEKCPLHSIERYEIVSAAFSDLRRSLHSIIVPAFWRAAKGTPQRYQIGCDQFSQNGSPSR